MSQLDIRVQSLLVKSQVLEKLNDFQRAIQELKAGKKLLETHFGPQHPLMSDFQQVEGLIMTQVQTEPEEARKGADELEDNDIALLLDRRSELMKRGRVKRVYYQVTQDVQQEDGRAEFAEQESMYKQQQELLS